MQGFLKAVFVVSLTVYLIYGRRKEQPIPSGVRPMEVDTFARDYSPSTYPPIHSHIKWPKTMDGPAPPPTFLHHLNILTADLNGYFRDPGYLEPGLRVSGEQSHSASPEPMQGEVPPPFNENLGPSGVSKWEQRAKPPGDEHEMNALQKIIEDFWQSERKRPDVAKYLRGFRRLFPNEPHWWPPKMDNIVRSLTLW